MHRRSYIDTHEDHPHHLSDAKLESLKSIAALSDNQKKSTALLRQASDPTKLSILNLLSAVDELPVTDIAHVLGRTQPTISHALADMKIVGLVQSRRCGKLICYSLAPVTADESVHLVLKSLFPEKLWQKKA